MRRFHQNEYQTSIAHVRSRIRTLENRKRDLLGQISEVKASLGECHAELAFLRNESSSVSSLPFEILAKTFELARQSSLQGGRTSPRSEVIFSHVARRWRQVALNVPSLWADIVASPQTAPDELTSYLDRSRASPLCIRLDVSVSHPGQDIIEPDVLLEIISVHASRWRRLVIDSSDVQDDDAAPTAIQLPDLNTPLLEHLSISNIITYCTSHPTIFTGGAPLLSFLRIDCFLMQSLPRPLPAPLTRLTTLHLDEAWYEDNPIPYDQFVDFISAIAMTLVNLSLKGTVLELDATVWPPAVIDLPVLRSIRIACDATVSHIVVAGITAPVLSSFEMKGVSDGMAPDEAGDFEEEVWKFLGQLHNFPALDSIILVDCSLSSWTFHHFAETYFTISHLMMANIQPDVLQCFLDCLSLGTLWPHLRKISFCRDDESPLQSSWVSTLVDARLRAGIPIDCIELDQPDLSRLMELENLRERVDLKLMKPYTWPEGLRYRDEDDDFMTPYD
jgi:hypothetical protein